MQVHPDVFRWLGVLGMMEAGKLTPPASKRTGKVMVPDDLSDHFENGQVRPHLASATHGSRIRDAELIVASYRTRSTPPSSRPMGPGARLRVISTRYHPHDRAGRVADRGTPPNGSLTEPAAR